MSAVRGHIIDVVCSYPYHGDRDEVHGHPRAGWPDGSDAFMEIACYGAAHHRGARNFQPSTPPRHQISPVHVTMASLYNLSRTSHDDPGGPPPGSPPTCTPSLICLSLSCRSYCSFLSPVKYEGPWLSTQIMISASIGMTSLFIFSYCRTRWPLLFAPRTKLKGTQL
jgi:hypothetical protein